MLDTSTNQQFSQMIFAQTFVCNYETGNKSTNEHLLLGHHLWPSPWKLGFQGKLSPAVFLRCTSSFQTLAWSHCGPTNRDAQLTDQTDLENYYMCSPVT